MKTRIMKKKRIKILIISGDMDVGGIQNQLMHLLRNADKKRFQIDFYIYDAGCILSGEKLKILVEGSF